MYQLISHSISKTYTRLLRKKKLASLVDVERSEYTFYINYLRPGMIVFDVGAHVGEISLLLTRFTSFQGIVHAFEASSSTFSKLTKLCKLTGRNNIILNHKLVADKKEIMKLYIYDEVHSGWNTLAKRPLHNYGYNVKPISIENIEAITIDEYCKENNISQIDLLKIDVEGAEYQVLLGARHMLENQKVSCCIFEFGTTTFDMGNTPSDIEIYLKQFGYKIRNIVEGNPVFPGRSNAKFARFSVHIAWHPKVACINFK